MPYLPAHPQKTMNCEICGRDTTATGRAVCYYCRAESTPEVIRLARKRKINVPDV